MGSDNESTNNDDLKKIFKISGISFLVLLPFSCVATFYEVFHFANRPASIWHVLSIISILGSYLSFGTMFLLFVVSLLRSFQKD